MNPPQMPQPAAESVQASPSTEATFILPCAGEGTRLRLETAKELHEVIDGWPMIRFSLEHIREAWSASDRRIDVACVIRPGKESIADFARQTLPGAINVHRIYFDSRYDEWPGSIHSAKETFARLNIVLLPDSFLSLSEADWLHDNQGRTLLELADHALSGGAALCCGAVACTDRAKLGQMGAVALDQGSAPPVVRAFQDKPRAPDSYNAFWACLAFKPQIADELHEFLIASVKHEDSRYESRSFFPASSFPVESYSDLGTWESIDDFRSDPSSLEFGTDDA